MERMMGNERRLADKVALVFGGSRGIGAAIVIKADSADPEKVRGAVTQTVAHFGRLDILVVNAGILIRGTVDTFPLEDFDLMLATNIRGVFVAVQASAPHLTDGGRIITIGSSTAVRTAV